MHSSPDSLVGEIVRLPRPLLVALDVDGTLAPIVDDPDGARVPKATRTVLRRIVDAHRVFVALVTGRSASSLRKVVRLPGAWRALEHGRTIVRPGGRVPREGLDRASRERLQSFETWVEKHMVPAGARLERKEAARVVHVRELMASDEDEAARILRASEGRAKKLGLHPRTGRAVVEAEAEPGDKGEALSAIAFAARARGVVYAGDDTTDVPALRRATRMGGVGIYVRSEERPEIPRGATGSVGGPKGMADLLSQLADALETG